MLYSDTRLGSLFQDLNASTFRKGALALTAAAAMFAGTSAHAGDFTSEQCKIISHISVDAAKAIGPEKLSKEFKTSWRGFLGANLTCDGPKDIFTPTVDDIAFFNSVKEVLYAPPLKLNLDKAGLRSVDPNKAATDARRPAGDQRSDAGAATKINLKID
jgi:hypothetical protein